LVRIECPQDYQIWRTSWTCLLHAPVASVYIRIMLCSFKLDLCLHHRRESQHHQGHLHLIDDHRQLYLEYQTSSCPLS
jgi:hypothetical protein